jgi:hypothetical protein
MRALALILRSALVIVGLVAMIALWVPFGSVADLYVAELDVEKPTLVALYHQRWGVLGYFERVEGTYLSAQHDETHKVLTSGFHIGRLVATVVSCLGILAMLGAAIYPASATSVIRRLTRRWSGP